jgi:ATP-binding cassette subfamily C (CFTR/MRP) protein 1
MSQVAKYIGPYRVLWNQAIQERVSATSSVLNQMKGVKLLGLTAALETNIQSLRNTELNKSRKYRWMIVWLNVIGKSTDMQ